MTTPSKNLDPSTKLEKVLAAKHGALSPDDTLTKAGDKMRALDASALPVADGLHLVGMVQEAEPDRAAAGQGHDPHEWTVGEIMNREVIFCFEDEDCAAAQRKMDEHDLRYLPVVDRQSQIVGILNREDIK